MKRQYHCVTAVIVLLVLSLPSPGCTADAGKPIVADAFDGPGGEWANDVQDGFSRGYSSGEYYFDMTKPDWFAWAVSDRKLTDSSVGLDARLSSGASDNHFGIICRLADAGDFYYLAISSDGFYGIFRRVDGRELEPLTDGGGMAFSPDINTGGETNHIEAICEGAQLELYANGKLLDAVTDTTHGRGRFGFGAGSGPDGSTRVHFDNLAVYER